MKYEDLGNLIKDSREKRGWDQAALAKAMVVKQQTVSRWEAGSRPREDDVRRLAELFDGEIDEWLMLSGYKVDNPVRPLVPFLPVDRLTAETFELFSRDFIQCLHPSADVHRYGSQGHTQEGIDLYAKEDEKILDYQCKRHKQFGPADIDQAVKVTTFVAEHHHLLLSRPASPDARKAMNKHTGWSLWDVEDISAKVRALPKDDALRIVDTYFPRWRKDFLGEDEPSPWLTPEQYYRPLNSRLKIFSHGWSMVGRKSEVQALASFAAQDENQVMLLNGRGGVGKSRVLRAFAESLPKGQKVLFMAQGADPNPGDIEQLPKEGVLVIDDAHEYSELLSLFSNLALTHPQLKLVVSTRPYGLTKLQDELNRSGMQISEDVIKLGDLSVDDARSLAEEIIFEVGGDTQYAPRIAEITKDCPLATVIGSRLVAEGHIKPEVLNNSEKFREHLLKSFRNIITGEIGGPKDAESIRELLDLVALIQPIDPANPDFEEVAKALLNRRYDKIVRDLSALEDAGVLLRRKNRLRIAPDLLADYIRSDASYSEKSQRPTGYADEVFKVAKNDLATNLLVNLSQLDWRISANGAQSAILDRVWTDLETQFKAAKILEREAILSALAKVAYYQPERALAFAKIAMENPTDEVEVDDEGAGFRWWTPSYADVLKKLPPVLKYTAYNQDYLPQSLDMLKELAKLDKRPSNQDPDHPMRALTELASIEPHKPVQYIDAVIEHVLAWLPEENDSDFSPFDVASSALATEGHMSEMSGIKLTLRRFKVRVEAVAHIRQKIIDKAFETIITRPTPEAARAVKIIEEALRGPWGTDVGPEDRAVWEPGFLDILKRLEELVANTKLDPFISVEVMSAVSWHANFSKTATRPAAKAVLKAMPKTLNYEVSRAAADGWGWTFERSGENHTRDEAAFNEWRVGLAYKLVQKYAKDMPGLVKLLEERVETLYNLKLKRHSDSGPFIGVIIDESPDFGEALGNHILEHPDSPLAVAFGVVIVALSKTRYDKAIEFAEKGLAQNNTAITQRISRALGWGLFNVEITPREMKVIEQLGKSDDPWTKQNIVRVANRFPKQQKATAIAFLTSIDFSGNKELADEVLGEFNEHGPFEVADLKTGQVEDILSRLVELESIDDYNIGLFVRELSYTKPRLALKLLLDRVERQEAHETAERYSPLPHSWDHRPALRFHETPKYQEMLETVRDWTNVETKSWYRIHYGPDVFKIVSSGYDDVTLRVLEEWVLSPNQQQLETVAALLSEAGNSFVWDKPQYVIRALDRAQQFGDACYKRVASSFYSGVIQGGRTGTPGQPFQEDIDQRDRSKEMMDKLSPGLPAYRFYKTLHESALANIKRDTVDEEDLFED